MCHCELSWREEGLCGDGVLLLRLPEDVCFRRLLPLPLTLPLPLPPTDEVDSSRSTGRPASRRSVRCSGWSLCS